MVYPHSFPNRSWKLGDSFKMNYAAGLMNEGLLVKEVAHRLQSRDDFQFSGLQESVRSAAKPTGFVALNPCRP